MRTLLKSLSPRKRRIFSDHSTRGMEYNNLSSNRKVSRFIYGADIARNPQVIKESFMFVDIMAEVSKVNYERDLIDYKVNKVKGRS